MPENRPDFGTELRRLRESAGMSLTALAAASHFTKGYLSKVENGKVRVNRRLAEVCDTVLGANGALLALVTGSPEPPRRRAGGLLGLPDVTRHFVGRDADRDRIVAVLRGPGPVRVCAIHGMAGVGKTALALSAAHAAEHDFPDGCLFFDLHGHTPGESPVTAAEAAHRVLRVLDIPGERIPPDLDGRANLYRDHLRGKRMLLIFDNIRDAQQVSPLIPAEPRCRVLITSRTRLTALDDAEHLPVRVLPAEAAFALFRSMLGDRVPAEDVITAIVTACGGLPLAIRIAAARLLDDAGLTPDELRERLAGESTRLAELDDGERSVAAALRVSCAHLPPEPRRLFGLLALHPGDEAEIGAVAALAGLDHGAAERLLARLSDAHLLTRRRGGYIDMHNLVRDYAGAHVLPTIPEAQRGAAIARLVDHALLRTKAADELIEPHRFRPDMSLPDAPAGPGFPDRPSASAWLRAAWPNLVALCRLASAHGMPERCWQLAFLLRSFFFQEKLVAPWIQTQHWAVEAARSIPDPYAEAITLNNLGMARLEHGEPEATAQCYRRALEIFTELGDRHGTTDAMANLAWVQLYCGEPEAALRAMSTALDDYRRAGRTRNEMITLRGLALAATELGSHDDALGYAQRARALSSEPVDVLMSLNCLGWVHYRAGNVDQAHEYYAETVAKGDGSRHELARAKLGLGNIAAVRGDRAEANRLWAEASELRPSTAPLWLEEAQAQAELASTLGGAPAGSAGGRQES